jgi:hypothetical protein
MDMTVSTQVIAGLSVLIWIKGELLEKVTRVLTPEEQAVLNQDWVGRDGSKRKVEVSAFIMKY